MFKLLNKLIVLAVLAAVLIYFHAPILTAMGKFLVTENSAEAGDAIVVLAGERGERTAHGVKLYQDGLADKLVLSGGPVGWQMTYADIMKRQAQQMGVRDSDIVLEEQSTSTYENAVFSKEIVQSLGYERVIVVTSPYHMRRTKWIFNKVYSGSGVALAYSAAENSWFTPDTWWLSDRGREIVVLEYVKLVGYFLRYFTV